MRHSLKHKAVLLIVIIALLISAVSIIVSSRFVADIVRSNYETESENLSRTAASVVDAEALKRLKEETQKIYDSLSPEERVTSDDWGSDAFYEYLSHYDELSASEDYKKVHHQLRQIQDANDVDCVYTCFLDPATEKFIYLVDAASEDACPIGCIDPLYEENKGLLDDPTIGFPTYTTNTEEYGYLATTGTPVYSNNGDVAGYAMVDISMDDIASHRRRLLTVLIGLQILMTVLVISLSVTVVNRALVSPINKLSQAASDYSDDEDVRMHNHFSELDIRTNDEIETLSDSMKKMESDLNDKISSLFRTTSELTASRQEVSKMSEIARKDALTGVGNKHAYNTDMDELADTLKDAESGDEAKFGLAVIDLNDLKKINDSFGHEKGDIAIRELCRIVCGVFAHSPVYRIGGDEFTVLLRGKDLENIEDLVDRLNRELLAAGRDTAGDPWERVNASIGYAVYDPERDETHEDTFRRADRAMYLRKREMKTGRGRRAAATGE